MATTRWSNSARPRRITSRWPSVSGSNVPVKTAVRDGSAGRSGMALPSRGPQAGGPQPLGEAVEVVGVVVDMRADPEPTAAGRDDHPALAELPPRGSRIDPGPLQRHDARQVAGTGRAVDHPTGRAGPLADRLGPIKDAP